jgi:hypothetical protein
VRPITAQESDESDEDEEDEAESAASRNAKDGAKLIDPGSLQEAMHEIKCTCVPSVSRLSPLTLLLPS